MYINHINKYEDAAAIQAALNEGSLANPYVAYDEQLQELDWNTLSQAPCYLGEWSDDGEGTYTFQTTTDKWSNPLQIGVLNNVYVNGAGGNPENVPVYLNYNPEGYDWSLTIGDPEDSVAQYQLGSPTEDYVYGILIGYTSDPEEEGYLYFNWGGDIMEEFDGKLELYSSNSNFTLSMTTINPLCSDAEPVTCQELCDGDPYCECLCQGGEWDDVTQTCMQNGEPVE